MKSQEEETGINCQNDQELAGTKRNPPPHLERGWETEREAAPRGDRRPRPPSIPQAEAGAASTRSRSPPLARGVAGWRRWARRENSRRRAATRPGPAAPIRSESEQGELPYAPARAVLIPKQKAGPTRGGPAARCEGPHVSGRGRRGVAFLAAMAQTGRAFCFFF